MEEKDLSFVLRHYKKGQLDTQQAIRLFRQRTRQSHSRRPLRAIAVAATVAVLIAAGAMLWLGRSAEKGVTVEAGSVAEACTLPDGSRITLSPGTSINYSPDDMEHGHRYVELSGTAYFEVKHNPRRPFIVSGQGATVKVLGTKFQIEQLAGGSSTVYVANGRVLFGRSGTGSGIVLRRGMKALLDKGKRHPQIIPPGSANQTVWATRIFVFDNTPMNEALGDLSAFYNVNLTASDSTQRITGTFEADDLNTIISVIGKTLGIKIEKE